ncbi:MAG: hypothetical protein U0Q16_34385 [Bryobacteraceae bacterium]
MLTISACLSLCVCYISANLHSRFEHRGEVVHNQFAILRGEPHLIDGTPHQYPQFQSRVLFPLALSFISKLSGLGPTAWYLLLRVGTAWVAFALFIGACMRHGAGLKIAGAGAGMLAYSLVFTFNHGWEHPTDFIDVGAFAIYCALALEGRRWAFAALVALGATNHQTAAFGAVIWFFANATKSRWLADGVYSSGVIAAAYAVSTTIARGLSREPLAPYPIDGYLTLQHFREAMSHPQPFAWPFLLVAMLVPVCMWLRANWSAVDTRLVRAAVVIIAISSPLAFWSEIRSVWLAPIVVLIFAATIAEGRAAETSGRVTVK